MSILQTLQAYKRYIDPGVPILADTWVTLTVDSDHNILSLVFQKAAHQYMYAPICLACVLYVIVHNTLGLRWIAKYFGPCGIRTNLFLGDLGKANGLRNIRKYTVAMSVNNEIRERQLISRYRLIKSMI